MHRVSVIASLSALALGAAHALAASVTWVASTEAEPSKPMSAPALVAPTRPADVRVEPSRTYQTIDGFGACFNELGWAALGKLPDGERERAVRLFFADDGLALTLGRIPIGASDFALDAYSLCDAPGDYELKSFSIERDRKHLLPFVKAAQAARPGLQCWASPWSPPAWMKTNGSYARGSIKDDPRVLASYADYFVKWVEAYKAEGVDVYAVTPQNEPNILNVYPTCEWSGAQLRTFVGEHLGPKLKARLPDVELWLGLNGDPPLGGDNANDRLVAVLGDAKANAFLTGVAYQYDSRTQIAQAHALYPDKKLMQSETDCRSGENSWADALHLYRNVRRYLAYGAGSYFMWNMVLDETGLSTWGWKQNAPVTADVAGQRLRVHGEYHVLGHFSRHVRPGARRALTTGPWGDQIAFVNADASVVIVMANSSDGAHEATVEVAGTGAFAVALPARSVHTFVVRGD